ncbi:MAG: ATP-binding protein [Bdellovibrionales bacterium]
MKNILKSIVNFFIHDSLKKDLTTFEGQEKHRKARLLVTMYLAWTLILPLMYVIRVSITDEPGSTVYFLNIVAVFLLGVLWVTKVTGNLTIPTVLFFVLFMTVSPIRSLNTGGVTSAVTNFMIIIPILGALLVEKKWVIYTTAIAALEILIIAHHEKVGLKINEVDTPAAIVGYTIVLSLGVVAWTLIYLEGQENNTQKEVISKNLELARQKEELASQKQMIEDLNSWMKTMLDSVDQGFLLFDSKGKCLPIYSRATEDFLETKPIGKDIWDVLSVPEKELVTFKNWLKLTFSEKLGFSEMTGLGMEWYTHSDEQRKIKLSYYPVRADNDSEATGEENPLQQIVLVSTDVTAEYKARNQARVEAERARMILKMVNNSKQFALFNKEFEKICKGFSEEIQKNSDWDFNLLKMQMHTIKGNAASLSIESIRDLAHQIEDTLGQLQFANDEDKNIYLESTRDLFSQLVSAYHENMGKYEELLGDRLLSESRQLNIPLDDVTTFFKNFSNKSNLTIAELEENFVENFMLDPISDVFQSHKDSLIEIARSRGKKVQDVNFNGDFKVLPEPYSSLVNSLTHAVRNIVDHGIERPGERKNKGKPPGAHINFNFEKFKSDDKDWIKIAIKNDGAGVNPVKVRQKLKEKGDKRADQLTDEEIIQMIFEPDFSTADEVTDLSGRGVGMSAIKMEAEKLGGRIWVQSKLNIGTELLIEVPYIRTI